MVYVDSQVEKARDRRLEESLRLYHGTGVAESTNTSEIATKLTYN